MIDTRSFGRGEKLIWSGRPSPIAYARRKGTRTFLLGIPFLAFALFWVAKASEAPGGFWLFGIPFVLIGSGLVLSPLWFYFRAGRTAYALTSTRAIVEMAPPFAKKTSFPLASIRFVEIDGASERAGHVLFFETMARNRHGTTTVRDGFIAIADPERVDGLLRAAVDNAAKQPAGEAA